MDYFSQGETYIPDERQLKMRMMALRLDPSYGKEAWAKIKVRSLIKQWAGQPSTSAFTAAKAEAGLLSLKFQDHKNFEKEFARLQYAAGAIGLIAKHLMCLMEDE